MVRRAWFLEVDGTFYRNCPLIMDELERPLNSLLWWRYRALEREWWLTYWYGPRRTSVLAKDDTVVPRRTFRGAYPERPELWELDKLCS